MDVKDAVIIDLVDGHDFNSFEDIADAEAVTDITGVALVKDKAVTVFVVTAYTAVVHVHSYTWTASGTTHTGTCACGDTVTHEASDHSSLGTGDATNHWKVSSTHSGCTIKVDEAAHSYTWTANGTTHTGTCTCTKEVTHQASPSGTWVNTDASQHWHSCNGAAGCTQPGENKASHQTAAEVKAAGGTVRDDSNGTGAATTHSWTCTCGKSLSEACTGSSSTACPSCGHSTD